MKETEQVPGPCAVSKNNVGMWNRQAMLIIKKQPCFRNRRRIYYIRCRFINHLSACVPMMRHCDGEDGFPVALVACCLFAWSRPNVQRKNTLATMPPYRGMLEAWLDALSEHHFETIFFSGCFWRQHGWGLFYSSMLGCYWVFLFAYTYSIEENAALENGVYTISYPCTAWLSWTSTDDNADDGWWIWIIFISFHLFLPAAGADI